MNDAVPRRVTVVFVGLVIATCVTWWLGSRSALIGSASSVAATLTILIAFAKVYFIGRDFMDLRCAPTVLRTIFTAWVAVVAAVAVALVLG